MVAKSLIQKIFEEFMRHTRKLFLSVFFFLMASGAHSDISAQVRDRAAVQQEFEAAFNQMIDDPSNVKLTMHYAELAVQLEDYESAIPPLERLLMQDPKLTDVRLELGVMYYLLNSHLVAKQYLNEVTQDQAATKEQLSMAKEYLAKM